MDMQLHRSTPQPRKSRALARTIHTERDYREGKTLLGRAMRSPRSHQAALRAEALLNEIIDFEIRLDAEGAAALAPAEPTPEVIGGLNRRWSDPPA